MKKRFFLLLSLTLSASLSFADLEIAGVYQGKNLYVQNPFTSNMKDYCTQEVFVNDVRMMSSVNASAYEIDLSFLPINEPVLVRITHKNDCSPKILNPQVVKIKTTFSFNSINLSDNSVAWSAKNEKPRGRYFIERFEFNLWRIVGETYSAETDKYMVSLNHNSGLNKYRLKYMEENGNILYSEIQEYDSKLAPLEFYPIRVTDLLYLSRETDYEILDKYGNVIKKGVKKEIDLTDFPSDIYYLNADNRTYKFFKK